MIFLAKYGSPGEIWFPWRNMVLCCTSILFAVRDSAARLPNGEGTRADICELLKDSQFLAPGVSDAQVWLNYQHINITDI